MVPITKASRETQTAPKILAPRLIGLGVFAIALIGGIAFAIVRGAPERTDAAKAAVAPPAIAAATGSAHATHAADAAPAARAVRTAEEEAYIRALWPIHGEVERVAMRLSLGQIFYKTKDLARAELKSRVEEALVSFQAADRQLRALAPPSSLKPEHETYVAAVQLFRDATLELRKMFADGRDDHMLAAYPTSQAASDKIRDVGGRFWPHEFPPH